MSSTSRPSQRWAILVSTTGHSFLVSLHCSAFHHLSRTPHSPLLTHVALIHTTIAIPTTHAIYHLTLIHSRPPPSHYSPHFSLSSLQAPSCCTSPHMQNPIFTFLSYAAVMPRKAVLHCRRRFLFELHPAYSLRPLVPSGPFPSSSTLPGVLCSLPASIPYCLFIITIPASPMRRIPLVLPCQLCPTIAL